MTDAHAHPPRVVERRCDVAVVGGSAAGLAAALQLVRQRRSVIVVDAGDPRNAPAPHVHGYLGREGTPPADLVAVGREEVRRYGGEVLAGTAVGVHRTDDGRFRVELSGGHALLARRVLVATGMVDELPAIEGLAERWGRDVVSCPFCHGFEVRDQRIVQIVTQPLAIHLSPLYLHLADRLTLVVHEPVELDPTEVDALRAAGAEVVHRPALRVLAGDDGAVAGVELAGGGRLDADAVVVSPRYHVRAELLAPLGLSPTAQANGLGSALEVDATGQTSVPGVFAAGNVADPSLQVLHAAAHGSRAGAAIARDLAVDDVRDTVRRSGDEADWDHRYGGEAATWSGNPNGTLVHEVEGLVPGRALDVGAGEGADAVWLAGHGWEVTATDISSRALARVAAEADRRGVAVACLHRDANAPDAFEAGAFDLVSVQYGAILRTPDERGVRNLLGAVAPGGTLLVVGHDLTPLRTPIDTAVHTRAFDPDAYVGVDVLAAAVAASPDWTVEVHETRPRPPGASTTQHVDDVVLRARRRS